MSPIDRRRYGRQIRLAEIGETGQAKLCAAKVELGAAGFARAVEERYVRAAGLMVEEPVADRPRGPALPDLAALDLRHEAARELAEGALRALISIHAALGARP